MHIKDIQEEPRGSGHWKFNSSLITDVAYTEQLGTKIEFWKKMTSLILKIND